MFRWQMTSMLKFVVCFAAASAAGAFPGTAAKADLAKPQFESDVAPILRQHCVKCHGEGTPQAGLDLRSASSVLRGGKSGLVVVRGAPEKSYLFQRVSARTMPPPGSEPPLNDTEIQTLRKWIESGEFVAEPATEAAADTATRQISEQDRQFWSFRKPSSAPVPKLKGNHRVRTPIDSFVLAKLEAKGLTFAPDASKVALLRRAYFDLLGLPPTPEERDAFLSDNRSDAYEQLVDRLLASPAYGERWARHWLDVAGYTEAAHNDTDLPLYKEYYVYDGIWRYRDYVVSSFNQDKPYDQFLSEQIAGDELVDWRSASKYTPEILNDLIATGFLRGILDITSFSPAPQLPLEYNNVLTRVVDNFSSGILGLTAGCARCHDHKYDPITQNDYYRMQSIFASAYNPQDWKLQKDRYLPDVSKTEQEEIDKHNAEIDRPLNEITKQLTDLRRPHQQRIFEAKLTTVPELLRADVRAAMETPADKRDPVQKYLFKKYEVALKVTDDELTKALSEKEQASAKKLEEQIAVLKGWRRSFGKIQALWDVGKPPTLHLLRRGNIETPGKEVEPGFFAVLCSPNKSDAVRPKDTQGNTSGRRLALARWVTSRDNPLTARVFVNQIWQHHFGKGIVSTPENFGRKGAPPTHPELLDWLAVDFMEHGWKIKRLHKLMMTSTTYRQSSELKSTAGIGVDPANDLLGRMNLRRLEAEAIRDNVLAVSGDLDRTFGGPPVLLDWTPDGLLTVSDKGPTPTSKWRRSLYMLARRNYLLSFLEVFDFPSLALNCTKRSNSATPLQSLTFLNSEFVMEQAEHFANRVNQLVGDSAPAEKKIEQAFVLALARRPSPTEIKACGDHLTKETQVYLDLKSSKEIASRQALTNICQTLLSTNEFLYLE